MARTTRKEKEVDRTRQDILQAAARAATRSGFDALTIRDIANEAGYTVRTLYNYFDSKDAIMAGVLQELLTMVLETLREPLPQGLTFRQKVELLVKSQLTRSEEWRDGISTLVMLLWGSPKFPSLDLALTPKLRDGLVKWIRTHAQPNDLGGKDCLDVAMFYFGVLAAVISTVSQRHNKAPLVTLVPRIMDLMFHGLGTPTEDSVEPRGIEPRTSALPVRRSPS